MKHPRHQIDPNDQIAQARYLIASCLSRSGFMMVPSDELSQLEKGLVGLTVNVSIPGMGEIQPLSFTGSLLELHQSMAPEEDVITCGGLMLDCRRRKVSIDNDPLVLTPRELQLLTYLMRNRDEVLTRGQLLGGVWELGYRGDNRTVDTHIKCLRRKLGEYGRCIVTVRKVGYRFDSFVPR